MGRKKKMAKLKAKDKKFFRERDKSEARFNIFYTKLREAARKGELSPEDPCPDLFPSKELDDDGDED